MISFVFVIFSNAQSCNAVDFCIKSVWETHVAQKDSDLICDDCKEWVGKARDLVVNLDNSGDIVRSLKWTCDLIPVETMKTDCDKLVDDNVPAIFKMLESKMEPVVVCSTVYLCNNVEYDEVLANGNETKTVNKNLLPFTCSQCNHIGSMVEAKFKSFNRDAILSKILSMCGEMSSYSDSCSGLAIMHFDDIYKSMLNLVARDNICRASDACVKRRPREGIVDIMPYSGETDPNIPCQLCEQMILHLRELLIANTSAVEFKNVMIGFCHQFGSFSDECVNIADQYSGVIYEFLQDKLSANKACVLIEICPSRLTERNLQVPSRPLIPSEVHPLPNKPRVIEVIGNESSLTLYKNGSACTTCEYFIHFVQEALRKQSTEDDIVGLMKKTCLDLPKKVQSECVAMVDLYGDAMMSLIDQELDARYICPILKLCPPNTTLEYLEETAVDDNPTCPFCLMAMQEIKDVAERNSTKQYIEGAIEQLCDHLSAKLKGQCTEFVKQYAEEVVEMVLADFTPQEACTFIKLCTDNKPTYNRVQIVKDEDLDQIDDDDSKEVMVGNPQCELCKEIVKIVESRVINKKSKVSG